LLKRANRISGKKVAPLGKKNPGISGENRFEKTGGIDNVWNKVQTFLNWQQVGLGAGGGGECQWPRKGRGGEEARPGKVKKRARSSLEWEIPPLVFPRKLLERNGKVPKEGGGGLHRFGRGKFEKTEGVLEEKGSIWFTRKRGNSRWEKSGVREGSVKSRRPGPKTKELLSRGKGIRRGERKRDRPGWLAKGKGKIARKKGLKASKGG